MLSRWQARGKLAMTGAVLCTVLTFGPAMAQAVSEEPIGASPQRPTVEQTSPPPAEEPRALPAPVVTDPSAVTNPSPPARLLQPHATFPYTLRSGDNLGSIAAEFGVSVADLCRVNHVTGETELVAGESFRIPNPGLARERELTAQVNQLTLDQQAAEDRAQKSEAELGLRRTEVEDLTTQLRQTGHDLRGLSWWRGSVYVLGVLATLMFGAMALALLEWWLLRNRFRAVAEMNESLRRLDYKYKAALAKAELRLQELYGRRRRGIHDGQERPKLAEEAEIERLNLELKTVLERHLARLGPAGASARRARWQERVSGIGSPVEARPVRR
jgi:LysM repeat protein